MKKFIPSKYQKVVKPLLLSLIVTALLLLGILCFAGIIAANESKLAAIPVDISDDGRYVLTTSASYDGLVLIDKDTGKSSDITDGNKAGYYATISPNN